jgi:hypothetical protein
MDNLKDGSIYTGAAAFQMPRQKISSLTEGYKSFRENYKMNSKT